MRVLAIGLGGAGGRIVDMLYRTDRRSSNVECVQALAVDVDADSLTQLTGLPGTGKIFFPQIDIPLVQDSAPTATIDIAEVTARVHTVATSETDAIIFCIGLGGSLAGAAPNIIAALRTSVTEPIFGLLTLPCLKEGERCSSKAADDLEMISPMLDGVIIFDNETWYKKIKAQQKTLAHEEVGFAKRLGFGKKKDQKMSPSQKIYSLLNQAIVRRISILLRAGEFKADGGIELAEVVLDAGEVLNTMRGMGFMTIGYAVEQLPSTPLDFLAKLRPAGFFADEHQKKASRIIDLAKQAIYHEISAPCDITSAHKALVLIAGPSHELSLKGYMTVRKWIDRSIAGLETRSGDYPVTSTKFVAIIIMLSGLENIPRIEELKEIRAQYKAHLEEIQSESAVAEGAGPDSTVPQPGSALPPALVSPAQGLKDEMISLSSGGKQGREDHAGFGREGVARQLQHTASHELLPRTPRPYQGRVASSHADTETGQSRQRAVISGDGTSKDVREPDLTQDKKALPPTIKKMLSSHSPSSFKKRTPVSKDGKYEKTSDPARQKIEQELQKQRAMAISPKEGTADRLRRKPPGEGPAHYSIEPDAAIEGQHWDNLPTSPDSTRVILKKHEMKKIVLHKKKDRADPGSSPAPPRHDEELPEDAKRTTDGDSGLGRVQQEGSDPIDAWIGQASLRAKEEFPDNKGVKLKDVPKTARDAALLHTNLKRGRSPIKRHEPIEGVKEPDQVQEIEPASKKQDKKGSDDVKWVR
jgi:tubulin-like protein CetZ